MPPRGKKQAVKAVPAEVSSRDDVCKLLGVPVGSDFLTACKAALNAKEDAGKVLVDKYLAPFIEERKDIEREEKRNHEQRKKKRGT